MPLRHAPIQRKLMTILLLTSGIVLLLSCAVFFVYEYISFRSDMVQRTTTMAEVIAANSTAALAFDNQTDAAEILASIAADRHVEAACLYDENGKLFARYPDTLSQYAFPIEPDTDGYRFEGEHLVGYHPVVQGGTRFGTLYVQVELAAMYERFLLYGQFAFVVIIASLVVAYILSTILQKQISLPVLNLARTARAVSEQRDYSVRAAKAGDDEVGQLTDAFNQMLVQIQEQDKGLRTSEQRFRALFENMPEALMVYDPVTDAHGRVIDIRYIDVNPAAERFVKRSRAEMLGHTSVEVFGGAPTQPALDVIGRVLRTGEPTHFSDYSPRLGRWFESFAYSPQPGQVAMILLDITDRKQAEEEIHRLNADLERKVVERTAQLQLAVKELEAFAYSVSHDLRAPLRVIDGFSQAVLEDYASQLPSEGKSNLETIRDGARRMGQLIDDLLTFSRLSREPLTRRRVDTLGLVRSVIAESSNVLRDRKVEIKIGELLPCHADPALLKQVWENLISNALKYTRKRETACVEIGSIHQDGQSVYFVRDNGTGFDMKYYNKLFGVFQRLHRAEEYDGTGVGLAIVKRIIDRHGGRVWAEAARDQGATFYFFVEGEHPV